MQIVSSACSKSANIKLQLVGKLQQAGKTNNLHQVCGVFGCVNAAYKSLPGREGVPRGGGVPGGGTKGGGTHNNF